MCHADCISSLQRAVHKPKQADLNELKDKNPPQRCEGRTESQAFDAKCLSVSC